MPFVSLWLLSMLLPSPPLHSMLVRLEQQEVGLYVSLMLGTSKRHAEQSPMPPLGLLHGAMRVESPLEAFKNGLHEIQMMQQAGLGIFSPDLAQLRGNELLQQLRSKLGMNYTPVGMAEAGSKEAFSAEAAYKFNAAENVAQELNRLTMEANRQREIQVQTGQKVLDAVKDAGIVRVKGIGG